MFDASEPAESTVDVKVLRAKIGELIFGEDFLESSLIKVGLLGDKL